MRRSPLPGVLCALALAASGAAQAQADPPGRSAERPGLTWDSDRPLTVRSDELDAQPGAEGRDRVVFRKNVRAERGDTVLYGDWLEVVYPPREGGRPAGGKTERIVARGAVRIEQGGTRVRCAEAVFSERDCTAECAAPDGGAELESGQDRISADRIVFDLCEGVFRATGSVRVRTRSPEAAE